MDNWMETPLKKKEISYITFIKVTTFPISGSSILFRCRFRVRTFAHDSRGMLSNEAWPCGGHLLHQVWTQKHERHSCLVQNPQMKEQAKVSQGPAPGFGFEGGPCHLGHFCQNRPRCPIELKLNVITLRISRTCRKWSPKLISDQKQRRYVRPLRNGDTLGKKVNQIRG
jgi:hypothetical protein